jgi:hypothetical protein
MEYLSSGKSDESGIKICPAKLGFYVSYSAFVLSGLMVVALGASTVSVLNDSKGVGLEALNTTM